MVILIAIVYSILVASIHHEVLTAVDKLKLSQSLKQIILVVYLGIVCLSTWGLASLIKGL